MKIKEFTLIKDGFFGGFLDSEKNTYKPLVFKGGEITINQVADEVQISVDSNTSTSLGIGIEEMMEIFGRVKMEDLLTESESRYRIKTQESIDFISQEKLFTIENIIDRKTIVFKPVSE